MRVGLRSWWIHPARDFAICAYAHAHIHPDFPQLKSRRTPAEIRQNGRPRGSAAGDGPGFPAHAQAARGLKIGVDHDYVLTRARSFGVSDMVDVLT